MMEQKDNTLTVCTWGTSGFFFLVHGNFLVCFRSPHPPKRW
jgi:hypothetical protein